MNILHSLAVMSGRSRSQHQARLDRGQQATMTTQASKLDSRELSKELPRDNAADQMADSQMEQELFSSDDLPSNISQMDLLKMIWSKVKCIDNVMVRTAKLENECKDLKKSVDELKQSADFMATEVDNIKQNKAESSEVQELKKSTRSYLSELWT